MTTSAPSLASRILDRITAGTHLVWTASDFLDLGSRAAADKALQRLVASGELRRVERGLYDGPQVSNLTGKPRSPNPRAVLDAIARRDQARMLVDGMTAANDLGLTTAVPARIQVLTDARLRPLTLGNQKIIFKQAAPSRLYWAGRPAMRVVQSLYWLHDVLGSNDAPTLARLASILADPTHGPAIRTDLQTGLSAMPIWMQSTVRQLLDSEEKKPRSAPKRPEARSPSTAARKTNKAAAASSAKPTGLRKTPVRGTNSGAR